MVSQSNDPSNLSQTSHIPLSEARIFQWSEIDLQETFRLIDTLVSAKVCLHFQIIPLRLENNCLVLGIVNSKDVSVLNYVRSLIANHGYSLQVRQLDVKNHQLIISAYFNHQRTTKQTQMVQAQQNPSVDFQNETLTIKPENHHNFLVEEEHLEADNLVEDLDLSGPIYTHSTQGKETITPSINPESLGQLSPQQLWLELLNRLLQHDGIGRLYFECHPHHGRIVWGQDGTIRLSLDQLKLQFFQEVINEAKLLAHLPLQPLKQLKKVELEQYHHQERVLIRIELKPGQHGEEGTLQILRGKALVFYQQQQMDELGEQAIQLAKQLERKLRQIHARTQINPYPFKAISTLQEVHNNIKRQLDLLQ